MKIKKVLFAIFACGGILLFGCKNQETETNHNTQNETEVWTEIAQEDFIALINNRESVNYNHCEITWKKKYNGETNEYISKRNRVDNHWVIDTENSTIGQTDEWLEIGLYFVEPGNDEYSIEDLIYIAHESDDQENWEMSFRKSNKNNYYFGYTFGNELLSTEQIVFDSHFCPISTFQRDVDKDLECNSSVSWSIIN